MSIPGHPLIIHDGGMSVLPVFLSEEHLQDLERTLQGLGCRVLKPPQEEDMSTQTPEGGAGIGFSVGAKRR